MLWFGAAEIGPVRGHFLSSFIILGVDNSWHAFEENPDSWSMDVALAIFPILCTSVTGNNEISGNIGQLSIYPNPSIGTLNVALTAKELSTVSVYNMLGA